MSSEQNKVVVAGIDMTDLYPEPFPDNVQTAELEVISLSKLLAGDREEMLRVGHNCKDPGFFYLDLTDDERGVALLRDAVECARITRKVLPNKTVAEKSVYKQWDRRGPYSKGYQAYDILPDGTPKYNESVNFPSYEMLGFGDASKLGLPDWLSPYTETYQRIMRGGHGIASIVYGALETALQVPAGSLTGAHRLEDSSDDFLRLLRYPGQDPSGPRDDLRFPAHKDFTSLGLLWTWVGGLQLPTKHTLVKTDDDASLGKIPTGPLDIAEDAWLWVKPLPGAAIVNVGLGLEIFTNKALQAGLHRVVNPPGRQMAHDRYSVLIQTRMALEHPMRHLTSPVIDEETHPDFVKYADMTCADWGRASVMGFDTWITERTKRQQPLIVGN